MSSDEELPIDHALVDAELSRPISHLLREAPSVVVPPAGFADRVLAAQAAEPVRVTPVRFRIGILAALAASVAVLAIGSTMWRGRVRTGSVQARTRESIELAGRGIAVVEAGAELRYRIASGAAELDQLAGRAFYRVERGGPFRVHTAAGTVEVHGTCFTVEVQQMKPRAQGLVGASVGAALATAVMVTVHEGRVSLANEHGQVSLVAGEQARAMMDRSPSVIAATNVPAATGADRELTALDHESLVRRAMAQQAELANLRTRMHELESRSTGASDGTRTDAKPFLHPAVEELSQLAKDCKLRWDEPRVDIQPQTIEPERAVEMGLTEEERLAMNRVNAEVNAKTLSELRALYVELTNDPASAEQLAPGSLIEEIQEKSPRPEIQATYQKLARERAGFQAPPADTRGTSPIERLMRLRTSLGDRYEQALGAAIGPDLARRLREERDGWGSHSTSSYGCPGASPK